MSRPNAQPHRPGHRYALTRLSSYIDDQLSKREQARVKAHLDTCPDCRQELRELRWTQDLAQQMPALPVPRSFIVREADLEPRSAFLSRARFARSLAGLQAAAAIVAVLLVLVVARDALMGTGFSMVPAAPPIARQTLATEAITTPISAAPKRLADNTDVGQQAQERETPPERVLAVVAETATEPVPTQDEPVAEPSPTTAGFAGENASTERSPTTQPTQTVSIAPAATLTPAPPPAAEPALTPELRKIAEVPKSITRTSLGPDETVIIQDVDSIPPDEPMVQRLGWRIAQAGLGLVLVGLVVAIVWMRLKQRSS